MTTPSDRPTVSEIAALTARLRRSIGERADSADRAAVLADKEALLDRIAAAEERDREATWPDPRASDETIDRAEAARRLVDRGFDLGSAEQMVTEYLHETSRRMGTPAYRWGLDQHDVEDIVDTYRWTRGQALDDARAEAAEHVRRLDRGAAGFAGDGATEAAAAAMHDTAREWEVRARVPAPFTAADLVDDEDSPVVLAPRAGADDTDRRAQLVAWHTADHADAGPARTRQHEEGP